MAKGKKGFKGPKDPFADLSEDFRSAVEGSSREEIESRIVKVVLDDVTLRKAKKDDQDLKEKQEAASFAAGIYRDGFKANKLKIEFMKKALDDKGGPINHANIDDLLHKIKNPGGGLKLSGAKLSDGHHVADLATKAPEEPAKKAKSNGGCIFDAEAPETSPE